MGKIFHKKRHKKTKGREKIAKRERRAQEFESEYDDEYEEDEYDDEEKDKYISKLETELSFQQVLFIIFVIIISIWGLLYLFDNSSKNLEGDSTSSEITTKVNEIEVIEVSKTDESKEKVSEALKTGVNETEASETPQTEVSNAEISETPKTEVSNAEASETPQTEASKTEVNELPKPEESKSYTYADGVSAGIKIFELRSEMISLYKSDVITQEQMQKYVNNYLNLINLSYADREISQEAIDNYNNSFKEITLVNYDDYQLKSIDKDYVRGFKNLIQVFAYNQMIYYFHDKGKISDEDFKAYCDLADPITYSGQEDDLKKIIEAGKKVLNVVGDPEKLMTDGEWRKFKSIEDISKTEVNELPKPEESKSYGYADGVLAGIKIFELRSKMISLYKSNEITHEQMQKYVNNYFNILNLSYADKEISQEAIDNYNNIFKEITLVNYDDYQLKSSDKDYIRGFKNLIQVFAYNQMVYYFHDKGKISDEGFKAYCDLADPITYSGQEDDLKKIIEAGKKVLNVVGDPEKLMTDGEWRKFKSIEDIDKIS